MSLGSFLRAVGVSSVSQAVGVISSSGKHGLVKTRAHQKMGVVVFVTGCDSGFGAALLLRLAERPEITVVAGCLTAEGEKAAW